MLNQIILIITDSATEMSYRISNKTEMEFFESAISASFIDATFTLEKKKVNFFLFLTYLSIFPVCLSSFLIFIFPLHVYRFYVLINIFSFQLILKLNSCQFLSIKYKLRKHNHSF